MSLVLGKHVRTHMQAEVQRLQPDTSNGLSSHKSPYTKIVAENDRLRKDLQREMERNEKLQLSLSTLEVQNRNLQEEVDKVSVCVRIYKKQVVFRR